MTILFEQTPCHVHSLHLTHSFLASVSGTSLLLFTLVQNRHKLIEMQASHFQISNPYKTPKTQALYHSCGRLISYATAPACSPHALRPSAHVKGGELLLSSVTGCSPSHCSSTKGNHGNTLKIYHLTPQQGIQNHTGDQVC